MQIVDPLTGKTHVEKRLRRYNEPSQPLRRGLFVKAEGWEWSSAAWYAGIRPVKIAMDDQMLMEPAQE